MDLDLNKFRTLIPICALYEESLLYLSEFCRNEQYAQGNIQLEYPLKHPESIYLLAGEVAVAQQDGRDVVIAAGTSRALYPLNSANAKAPMIKVRTKTATFVRVDTHLLDKLLAWGELAPEASATEEVELAEGPNAEESEWMMSMLATAIFKHLPANHIQELFSRMEEIKVNMGNVIIRKGEPGKYYYVIREGRCKVTLPSESGETILAELDRCSSFGEEALIADTTRNANVTMLSPGVLMRLSKKDFVELMEEPVMHWVKRSDIQPLVNHGAQLIDVRFKREFIVDGLPGALNIPINMIRNAMPKLDRSKNYILYCDNGQRSSVAAFLLVQNGFSVQALKGGLGHSK